VDRNDIPSITGAFTSAFYDLDEDGSNDILILSQEKNENGTFMKVNSIYNNYPLDTYFFKVIGLNGICTERCKDAQIYLPDPKPYGVNQYGSVFKFTYSDMNAYRNSCQISPLHQSAFLSLQTPYRLIGLGRPSNYIDYLFYGIPFSSQKNHFGVWPGIIPNAQIVAVPYPTNNPDDWLIELYLSPGEKTLAILISVVLSLIFIGIAICVLNNKEKKEDLQEQQKIFSFRAL